jgi:hypothetical protein
LTAKKQRIRLPWGFLSVFDCGKMVSEEGEIMQGKRSDRLWLGICAVIIIFSGVLEAMNNGMDALLPLSLGVSVVLYVFSNLDIRKNDERTQLIKGKSGFLAYAIGLISVGVVYASSRANLIDTESGVLIALSIFMISYPLCLVVYSRLNE